MTKKIDLLPFNTPFETGIRSLTILVAAYPEYYDLQRLIEMDYIVVHSGDADGPDSLHVALPMRSSELLIRSTLVKEGLMLMMSRGLVNLIIDKKGFSYIAGERATPFINSLTDEYSVLLKMRAKWTTNQFKNLSTQEIRGITHSLFQKWSCQFHEIKKSDGYQ